MLYDCVIVGGGPAGLSAAVYMGRFLRRTVVLDGGEGRSSFDQVNDNYLGFPDGIKVRQLRTLGIRQAERFGVEVVTCQARRLERSGLDFTALTDIGSFSGRTVILCTGVCDIWPDLPNVLDYVGRTLFWCITCDGFRSLDKRLVLFGLNDDAATSACQFRMYTRDITFLTPPGKLDCSAEKIKDLEIAGVKMLEGVADSVEGSPEEITAVKLADGRRIPADLMFSLLGVIPNNHLAKDLGMELTREGYIRVDQEGNTSVPGVFAAGDISNMHTHQVISAAHEGAEAAQTANYYLYADYQKL